MDSVAERVVLLYAAVIVADVEKKTADVPTVKLALVAPDGTVTLAGTRAGELLLESATCAPPAGAGALRVTVPVDDCAPPKTLVGLRVSDASVGSGGVTVNDAERAAPPYEAEMLTVADAETALVVITKVAVVAPAA